MVFRASPFPGTYLVKYHLTGESYLFSKHRLYLQVTLSFIVVCHITTLQYWIQVIYLNLLKHSHFRNPLQLSLLLLAYPRMPVRAGELT